jgi:hypothetical protein
MAGVFMSPFASMVNIKPPSDCEIQWFRGVGWCQARRRTHACEQALTWKADLIVQLDVDQIYEPDVLQRLVGRIDEGHDVVAAMVPGRGYVAKSKAKPFQRLAWRSTEDGQAFKPVDPDEGEMVEAQFPTSACVIFKAGILKSLRRPWYFNTFKPEDWSLVQGEDGVFFHRLEKELGVKSWVDTTIRVKHAHVFGIDETFPDRFADWQERGAGEEEICNYGEAE